MVFSRVSRVLKCLGPIVALVFDGFVGSVEYLMDIVKYCFD